MPVPSQKILCVLCCALGLAGCTDAPWNSPYPGLARDARIVFSSFSERPKHLDPVRAYSANEYAFIAQIYEPPLQYHYLKRPYTLEPLTAHALPQVVYLDERGRELPGDARREEIAYSEYRIAIRPGIRYQPHPAFARDAQGHHRYHDLGPAGLVGLHSPADLPHSDSRELVAADYVYQIKRLADPRSHSPIAGLMGEHILGFEAFRDRLRTILETRHGDPQAWLDLRRYPLEGVQETGRYRYRVRLRGLYPQFRYWLAMPFFAPMAWEVARFYAQSELRDRNITLDWYPVGTGPFMLTENNPNLRMVLARNPNFHPERYPASGAAGDRESGLLADAGRRLPLVERAVYSLEKEDIPYWNKFLQGYYDSSGVSSDSFDQAIRFGAQGELQLTEPMRAKGIALASAVNTSVYYMGFNMLDPVVGGDSERARALRRAISIAVDYEEYISIFTNGRGIAAQGPLPPGIFGYRAGREGINPYVYQWVAGRARRRPVAAARALMAQAGYPGGLDTATGRPLVLYLDTVGAGPDAKARLNWMRKQFAKLGIQLVVRNTDYNRFQDKMSQGTEQIFQWGWNADYPDPENFLFLLYGPNAKVGPGGENAANYRNPDYDRLFERMKDLDDGPERQALIDRMVEILRRDAPWVFGFHPKTFVLYHDWYHNVKPNLMASNTLKYLRVDPARRARSQDRWNRPVVWPLGLAALVLVALTLPAWAAYRRRERATAL